MSGRWTGFRRPWGLEGVALQKALQSLRRTVFKKKKGLVTPTETKLHGYALCFMVETWTRHRTTEALLNISWRWLAVVGSCRLAVGGWWRLAVGGARWSAVGGTWLAVPRGCTKGLSLTKKKKAGARWAKGQYEECVAV